MLMTALKRYQQLSMSIASALLRVTLYGLGDRVHMHALRMTNTLLDLLALCVDVLTGRALQFAGSRLSREASSIV